MPDNTVPNASQYREDACQFSWCTTNHAVYSWELDLDENPGRFHENEPTTADRLRHLMPSLVVEEVRTPNGVQFYEPYVSFDGQLRMPVETALDVLHDVMVNASRWRDIAAEFAIAREVDL